MTPAVEQKLEEFRRSEIERTLRAGLPAYLLNEDGSVTRISPDGRRDRITMRLGYRHVQPLDCPAAQPIYG